VIIRAGERERTGRGGALAKVTESGSLAPSNRLLTPAVEECFMEPHQKSGGIQIRSGETRDLTRIVTIYNHYVTTTHITFDNQAFVADQRRPWFDGFAKSGPHRLLVAELGSKLVGYASSTRFKERPAYSSSVETTIYVAAEERGNAYGKQLYTALLDALCAEDSVHRAYGVIALPNPESIALHRQLGFNLVGTCDEVGYKFEKYWDVSWYEKDVSG